MAAAFSGTDRRTELTPSGYDVSLRGVGKSFGEREALCNLDLSIAPGEFVAIIGESGCGKSTLLRLLAGLETPTKGQIRVGNSPVHALPSNTRLMFQDARLLPWKRVAANVALGLSPRENKEKIAEKALAQVGLADRANDWPTVLSGGQRQRVALARALAAAPRMLLLDEPLGALDALTRRGMQELIARLWQEQRFTAVLVTHDPEEAVALADRVLVLNRGRITLDLPIDLPRPRPRGTAAFAEISERLLDAILHHEEDDLRKSTDSEASVGRRKDATAAAVATA